MRFVNNNWYIALAFCLVFFIGGRQLADTGGASLRARRLVGLLLFIFALPALLFPLATLFPAVPPFRQIAASPWYNTLRSINRIELFCAMLAPFAGYSTGVASEGSPYGLGGYGGGFGGGNGRFGSYGGGRSGGFGGFGGFGASFPSSVMRVIKPLAFPLCVVLISSNFMRPVFRPLPGGTVFADEWADGGVLYQSVSCGGGPAALVSAMYSLNRFADSELEAVKGTYTDGGGTDFWYLARYAVNRGYRCRFYAPERPEDIVTPSVARFDADFAGSVGGSEGGVAGADEAAGGNGTAGGSGNRAAGGSEVARGSRRSGYVAVLGRSESGVLTVGDPEYGRLELLPEDFTDRYGVCGLALALSLPASAPP